MIVYFGTFELTKPKGIWGQQKVDTKRKIT